MEPGKPEEEVKPGNPLLLERAPFGNAKGLPLGCPLGEEGWGPFFRPGLREGGCEYIGRSGSGKAGVGKRTFFAELVVYCTLILI